ncbi:MAG: type II toxin-antitoxin system HicB family antitoxin [Thermomicrobium sp.]|nr:type II toxin-antitoxin system HicB family antitoxin [Thermomicrobium sp.]
MHVPWRLLAERWEASWLGYVVELPGCQFAASTLDELLARAPEAIAQHLAWLRGHGLQAIERSPERFVLVETAEALPDGRGPLFEGDRRSLSEGELQSALRVGDAALVDLVALTERTDGWERLPEAARPTGRTPPEILQHVAERDRWYAARLAPDAGALALPVDPIEALERAAQTFVSVVRAWWAIWKQTVVERDGERWTVAKVLRRRTGHLREHARQLAAWCDAIAGREDPA